MNVLLTLGTILVNLGLRLLTDQFLSRVIYYELKARAQKTDSKFDDEMVDALGKAWGIIEP